MSTKGQGGGPGAARSPFPSADKDARRVRLRRVAVAPIVVQPQLFLIAIDSRLKAWAEEGQRGLEALIDIDGDVPLFEVFRHARRGQARGLDPDGVRFLELAEVIAKENIQEMVQCRLEEGGAF